MENLKKINRKVLSILFSSFGLNEGVIYEIVEQLFIEYANLNCNNNIQEIEEEVKEDNNNNALWININRNNCD